MHIHLLGFSLDANLLLLLPSAFKLSFLHHISKPSSILLHFHSLASHSPERLAKRPICFLIFTSLVPNWLEGICGDLQRGGAEEKGRLPRQPAKSGHKLQRRTDLINPQICNFNMTPCHPLQAFFMFGFIVSETEVKKAKEEVVFWSHIYEIWCSGLWQRNNQLDLGGGFKLKYIYRVRNQFTLKLKWCLVKAQDCSGG